MLLIGLPGALAQQVSQALTAANQAQTTAQAAQSAATAADSAAQAAMAGMLSPAAWSALVDRVAALESAPTVKAFGFAPIPSLALGAQAVVPVTIGPARPSTSYAPVATLISLGAVLATLEIVGSPAVTSTSVVTVTVKANGVLAGGAAFVSVRV